MRATKSPEAHSDSKSDNWTHDCKSSSPAFGAIIQHTILHPFIAFSMHTSFSSSVASSQVDFN